jgi:hypothetical protein
VEVHEVRKYLLPFEATVVPECVLMLHRFGAVHLALQLIPGLSMLFLLTTAAGSGMWAAKLEKKRRLKILSTSAPAVISA